MFSIDASTDHGARALRRLKEEEAIWITVVDSTLTPRSTPVWFLWDGETILIYSEPTSFKVRRIEANPRVNLHFNADEQGHDVVVLTGDARIEKGTMLPSSVPAYGEKYREAIARLGTDLAQLSATYSAAIIVTPDRLSGF